MTASTFHGVPTMKMRRLPPGSFLMTVSDLFDLTPEDRQQVQLLYGPALDGGACRWATCDRLFELVHQDREASLVRAPSGLVLIARWDVTHEERGGRQ